MIMHEGEQSEGTGSAQGRGETGGGVSECQCGCGLPSPLSRDNNATMGYIKGQPMRFRKGHRLSQSKYRVQRNGNGVTAVHIVVAERAVGRRLPKDAQVHHLDGDTHNNAPRNLVICENDAFHKLLHTRARIVSAGGDPNTQQICDKCRVLKFLSGFALSRNRASGRQTRCRECSAQTSLERRLNHRGCRDNS